MQLLFAVILGAFRSWQMNGVRYQQEWSDLARALIVVACQDRGPECSMHLALRHSQELRSLGKSAELTSVQLSAFVLEMKKLVSPIGARKEPSNDDIALGFAKAGGEDSTSSGTGKYKLTSGRVVKAYVKIGDILLSDTEAFHEYINMIEKWGPECIFHCAYQVEDIIHGLGEANYQYVGDFLAMIDVMLSGGDFKVDRISRNVFRGKATDKEVIVGLVHVFLLRMSTLQFLHGLPVVSSKQRIMLGSPHVP